MFQKFFAFLLLSQVAFMSVGGGQALDLSVEAEAAILMNAETGAILFEKNAKVPHYPASTTKIATGILVLEEKGHHLDEIVTAQQEAIASIDPDAKRRANYKTPPHWVEKRSTHIGIKRGEQMTIETLLYGLLLASANDAANVLAQHVGGGSFPVFMAKLNQRMKEWGCENTHFMNAHGLHHPEHVSTAYDLAMMARQGLKHPLFKKIVSTCTYVKKATNMQPQVILGQHNLLLKRGPFYYPKAIGIKNGYTSAANHNLVAAAQEGDRTLIAVVLGSPHPKGPFIETRKMFEAAFNQPKMRRTLLKKGVQSFTLNLIGAEQPLQTVLNEETAIEYYAGEEPQMKGMLVWRDLKLPISAGQQVGEVQLLNPEGQVWRRVPLFAAAAVQPTTNYALKQWFAQLGVGSVLAMVVGGGALVLTLIFFVRRRRGT